MLGIISGKWMMEYSPMIFCSRKETPIKNGVQTQTLLNLLVELLSLHDVLLMGKKPVETAFSSVAAPNITT